MHPQILNVRLCNGLRMMLLASVAWLTRTAFAQVQPQLNVIPMPASVQMGSGQLTIDRTFTVSVAGAHDNMVDRNIGPQTSGAISLFAGT